MANDCNRTVADSDREFLTRQGANEREIVVTAGIVDGWAPWEIGQAAGYGAGRSGDPEKQRLNWAAAVSRAAKRGGRVVPRIQALIDALTHYRANGESPKVAAEKEVLEKLSTVIRGSSDASVISAARTLLESYRRDRVQVQLTREQAVAATIARVGFEKARIGLEALAPNLLPILDKMSVGDIETASLASLNGAAVEFEERLSALEASA